MKELKTFEDFENYLKLRPIPEFDENLIINRIYAKKSERCARLKIKAIVLIAALLVIMISSIVYGKNIIKLAVKSYNVIFSVSLNGNDGKTAFEYQKVEYSDDEVEEREKLDSIYKRYSEIMSIHKYKLKDNELELFVIVDAYKINGSFMPLYKNKRFNLLDDVIENSTIEFRTPGILPDRYHFKYGYITEDHIENEYIGVAADELYNKALHEGKDYITQKFKTANETSEIYLNFAENDGHNDIEIRINRNFKEFDDNLTKVEAIDINGHEAIYKTYGNENHYGSTSSEIIFVDNNISVNLTYIVTFPSSTNLYEDMYPYIIRMIESMFK